MFQLMTVSPKIGSSSEAPLLQVEATTADITFDNVSFELNSLFSSHILQCFNFTINLIFIFLHLTNKYLQNEELEFSIDISFTMW